MLLKSYCLAQFEPVWIIGTKFSTISIPGLWVFPCHDFRFLYWFLCSLPSFYSGDFWSIAMWWWMAWWLIPQTLIFKCATYAWIAPFIGALIRPVGSWIADKAGGSLVTQICSVIMIICAVQVQPTMQLAYPICYSPDNILCSSS